MTLRADDGSPLEVKEAAVLGSHGETLFEPNSHGYQRQRRHEGAFRASSGARVVNLTGGWSILGILAVVAFLVVGGFFFSVVAAIGLAIWLVRRVLRLLLN